MSKNQFTGTATQPQRNRKFYQFNKDQNCIPFERLETNFTRGQLSVFKESLLIVAFNYFYPTKRNHLQNLLKVVNSGYKK